MRTWNLFHGNASPPAGGSHLPAMLRLASADAPAILCVQELPLWSFRHLERWTGMRALAEVAAPARIGPLPSTPEVGRRITGLASEVLRSAFAGQGNAILLAPGIRLLARHRVVLNTRGFRRAQARRLRLPLLARLAWAKERRVAQAAHVELPDGRRALVANLHATSYGPDDRLPDAELLRAAVWADALAGPREACVLAGDFNIGPARSRTLADLASPEWGFSAPAPGIDHVLVRGAEASGVRVWPPERRREGPYLLSDHAPVEVELA